MAKKIFIIFLFCIYFSIVNYADAASEASFSNLHSSRDKSYFVKMSYMTSRANGNDFRSFKSSTADESGSMSENSSMPNLNYVSARALISPVKNHSFMFGGLQSLDSDKSRTISGPNNLRKITLPGQILALRYMYQMSRHFSLSAGQVYVDRYKFLDPSIGLNYKNIVESGWGQRIGLSSSIPTTERSRGEGLITRSTIHTGLSHRTEKWLFNSSLAYSRPFYANPSKLGVMNDRTMSTNGSTLGAAAPAPTASAAAPATRGGKKRNANDAAGTGQLLNTDLNPSKLEEVDLVLMEREVDRSTGSMGVTYTPSRHWGLASGMGLTYLQTARQQSIWLTSSKLLGVIYKFSNMEAVSDLQMYSDIHKYKSPSWPRLWSLGFHISYFFGTEPKTI